MRFRARKLGLAEFNDLELGVNHPALVLFNRLESDSDDQIALLEQVVSGLPADLSVFVLEKECIDFFAQRHKVKGSPTYLLFDSGQERGRILGKSDYSSLLGFIRKHLSLLSEDGTPEKLK